MKNIIHNIKRVWIAVFIFTCYSVNAQVKSPKQFFVRYLRPESNDHILIFRAESGLTKQQVINSLVSGTDRLMPSYVSLNLKSEKTSQMGIMHTTYQIMVNNVELENAVVKFHEKNGHLKSASLDLFHIPEVNTFPSVQINIAKETAAKTVTTFSVNQADQAKLPAPKLLVSKKDSVYLLVWKVVAYGKNIFDRYFVYIDGHTGSIIRKVSTKMNCGSNTLTTLYNGSQSVYNDGSKLLDDCAPHSCSGSSNAVIQTKNFVDGSDFLKGGGAWSTDYNFQKAYSVQWALGKTFDYYYCETGLDGLEDGNDNITGYVNYYNGEADADPLFNEFHFGNAGGSFCYPAVSLDIVAHEYTHGVTFYTSGLNYAKEAGALNEAWSDIFGTIVEFYVEGSGGDWLCGEDAAASCGSAPYCIRSMSDPKHRSQPDTYKGTYWFDIISESGECSPDGTNDYCGVHTNSGVANYWFYLLATGDNSLSPNDNGNTYSVSGIGIDDAAAIAYESFYRISAFDKYPDARLHTILAAEDLYDGECTNQVIQVARAWYAVGVGNPYNDVENACGYYLGGGIYGYSGGPLIFKAVNSVRSGSTYCSNSVSISSGADVTFLTLTGGEIDLSPGFVANSGSTFLAEISPCEDISTFRQSNGVSFVGQGSFDANIDKDNVESSDVLVYPNPTSGVINVDLNFSKEKDTEITVLNTIGKEIYFGQSGLIQAGKTEIDLSNQTPGMYVVKVKSDNYITYKKVIISK